MVRWIRSLLSRTAIQHDLGSDHCRRPARGQRDIPGRVGSLPSGSARESDGYCTIIDDDDAIAPPDQRIAKGEKGIINIRLIDRGRPYRDDRRKWLCGGCGRRLRRSRLLRCNGHRCAHDLRQGASVIRPRQRDDHRDESERRFRAIVERLPLSVARPRLRIETSPRGNALSREGQKSVLLTEVAGSRHRFCWSDSVAAVTHLKI